MGLILSRFARFLDKKKVSDRASQSKFTFLDIDQLMADERAPRKNSAPCISVTVDDANHPEASQPRRASADEALTALNARRADESWLQPPLARKLLPPQEQRRVRRRNIGQLVERAFEAKPPEMPQEEIIAALVRACMIRRGAALPPLPLPCDSDGVSGSLCSCGTVTLPAPQLLPAVANLRSPKSLAAPSLGHEHPSPLPRAHSLNRIDALAGSAV
jgi:hypothetical protein